MNPAPASVISRHAFCLISLFLSRLLGYIERLETSGEQAVPADVAYLVISANAMVHAFIRSLAVTELKSCGYLQAGKALRAWHTPQAIATHYTSDEPFSPAELRQQLEASIALFERADLLAHQLACMIVSVLGLAFPVTRPVHPRPIAFRRARRLSRIHAPAPAPWPPPDCSRRAA